MVILLWIIAGIFGVLGLFYIFWRKPNMPKKDIEKNRIAGIVLLIMALGTAALFVPKYNATGFITAIIGFFLVGFIAVVIALYKIQSIERKAANALPRENNKLIPILASILYFIFVGSLAALLINAAKPPVYEISGKTLNISSQFGETINLEDIKDIKLKDSLPENLRKKYGADIENVLKGKFNSDDGVINLYVDTSNPPFIYIYTNDGLTVINDKTSSATRGLYNKLKALI